MLSPRFRLHFVDTFGPKPRLALDRAPKDWLTTWPCLIVKLAGSKAAGSDAAAAAATTRLLLFRILRNAISFLMEIVFLWDAQAMTRAPGRSDDDDHFMKTWRSLVLEMSSISADICRFLERVSNDKLRHC